MQWITDTAIISMVAWGIWELRKNLRSLQQPPAEIPANLEIEPDYTAESIIADGAIEGTWQIIGSKVEAILHALSHHH